ncbi:MAG: class I SAM-dependent methyltransferase [Herpetosiphon sp.]
MYTIVYLGGNVSQSDVCRVCGSSNVQQFLERDQVPAQQNVLMLDQSSALTGARGNIRMVVCTSCGFVCNDAFDPSTFKYDDAYDNNQAWSPVFDDHMSTLVDHLVADRAIKNARIIEIGCGQGLFLTRLAKAAAGSIGVGYDPSYVGPADALDGRLHFVKQYFGPTTEPLKADFVISRHVIEHIQDPVALLQSIRQSTPDAKVFFETPDVEWILAKQAIWDIFYEHCSYFSADSLRTAFETAGYHVNNVQRVFQDQYLWIEAVPASLSSLPLPTCNAGNVAAHAAEFGAAEGALRSRSVALVQSFAKAGGIALWGAGAKGVTFANLVDPDCQWIDCVIDINPAKQRHYIPGTGHAIIAPADLPRRDVRTIVLMNPNYHEEVAATLAADHREVDLIDLTEWSTEVKH